MDEKKMTEMIDEKKAEDFLNDREFVKNNKMNRLINIVRDPKNPERILSMTVMEDVDAK